eukprot:scaffold60110_cov21-Tisochrysis_lutea.AAC.2
MGEGQVHASTSVRFYGCVSWSLQMQAWFHPYAMPCFTGAFFGSFAWSYGHRHASSSQQTAALTISYTVLFFFAIPPPTPNTNTQPSKPLEREGGDMLKSHTRTCIYTPRPTCVHLHGAQSSGDLQLALPAAAAAEATRAGCRKPKSCAIPCMVTMLCTFKHYMARCEHRVMGLVDDMT